MGTSPEILLRFSPGIILWDFSRASFRNCFHGSLINWSRDFFIDFSQVLFKVLEIPSGVPPKIPSLIFPGFLYELFLIYSFEEASLGIYPKISSRFLLGILPEIHLGREYFRSLSEILSGIPSEILLMISPGFFSGFLHGFFP